LEAAAPLGITVSEALADPTFAADGAVEFVELCGNGDGPSLLAGTTLRIEQKAFALPAISLLPDQALVLCRDTSQARGQGLPCDLSLPGFSLPNGRALWMQLTAPGISQDFILPASRPGESQVNQDLANTVSARFQASVSPYRGDFASPGKCRENPASTGDAPENDAALSFPRPEKIHTPWISSSHFKPGEGSALHLVFPSAYAGGKAHVLDGRGKEVFTWDLTGSLADQSWKGCDARGRILPPGPYLILVLAKGKRWLKPVVLRG